MTKISAFLRHLWHNFQRKRIIRSELAALHREIHLSWAMPPDAFKMARMLQARVQLHDHTLGSSEAIERCRKALER